MVSGRDSSVRSRRWSVKGHQLLDCLCAQGVQGTFACSSQRKWCCPDETHITVVPFDLSQALLWALNKEVSVWLFSQQTNGFGGESSLYPAWLNSVIFFCFFFLGVALWESCKGLVDEKNPLFLMIPLYQFSSKIIYMVWVNYSFSVDACDSRIYYCVCA